MRTSETARAHRFATYVDQLATALGHRDRHDPLRAYVTGLCLPGDRKSIEPMAARVDPRHVRSRHQSMHHFIADAPWAAAAVLRVAREWVLAPMVQHGPVAAWIVDDTGFPKKGQHSVGVARQYCGVLGKQDNCQVAVSVSVANDAVSLPVAYQLYLPESWARDRRRRRAVGVPAAVVFQPKWQIALGQIQTLQAEGLPQAPVVADAGYGDTTAFREALTTAGLPYVVGVKQETTVWPPGQAPRPPKRWKGLGRPPTHVRRTATHTPQSLTQVARALPATAWRTVTWREGTRGAMHSRFARLRVRPAHRDEQRPAPPSSASRSSAGASSATIRNSRTSSGSTISRAAGGEASIIMARYVSRRTRTSPPSARGFPPLRLSPSSAPIATTYELLARALLQRLPCRSCGRSPETG